MTETRNRREVLRTMGRVVALGGLAAAGAWFTPLRRLVVDYPPGTALVWQLDPRLCTACGKCATACVRVESAVRCVHAFDRCGYCEACSGFFDTRYRNLDEGAENQLCPTGAIRRAPIEDPYFEYIVDRELCTACGRCVDSCGAFGNGSLALQIAQDLCEGCNQCAIADACPAQAFRRVPADAAYLLRG